MYNAIVTASQATCAVRATTNMDQPQRNPATNYHANHDRQRVDQAELPRKVRGHISSDFHFLFPVADTIHRGFHSGEQPRLEVFVLFPARLRVVSGSRANRSAPG